MAKNYTQLVPPRLNTEAGAGWCLAFAQKFFGVPHLFASAWEAYLATSRKKTGAPPTGAAVVLWFEHWGTYQGVYANWGHVAIHVPGKGIYTSPWFSSYGQEIYQSIGEIERIFHARYVGWTDNISHVRVAEPDKSQNVPLKPDLGQEEEDEVNALYYMTGKTYNVLVFNSNSGLSHEYSTSDPKLNNSVAKAWGTGNFVKTSKSHYDRMKSDLAAVRGGK